MDRHAATRRLRRLAAESVVRLPRMHPHMLRHTFVTTMLDAGVDLRDVQIAARHAVPRTTMRYDRARNNLDRHPNYILAAYMAPAPNQGPQTISRWSADGRTFPMGRRRGTPLPPSNPDGSVEPVTGAAPHGLHNHGPYGVPADRLKWAYVGVTARDLPALIDRFISPRMSGGRGTG
jgi:hypothetical protein